MRYSYYLILFLAFLSIQCTSEPQKIEHIAIIPQPLEQTQLDGYFILDDNYSIDSHPQFSLVSLFLSDHLENIVGTSASAGNTQEIVISQNLSIENEEGYTLKITPEKIMIGANSEKGAFYAVQSLLQLFPAEIDKSKPIAIPSIEIKDKPRFKYRGMHLDVARHMYSVDFIKKYIDMMARLKLNTFHWHLTEDQGWRIEIKKYPKLQEIAAYRKETLIGHYSDQPHQFDGKRYGGYYTQEQIREVVKYAQERHITVVPEIEMPGHSQAAIAAYPELG